MENKTENKKIQLSFAAINQYVEDNIIRNNQKEIRGREIIEYGDRNLYPQYLFNLYQNVSVLKSIVNGIADYVCGENVTITQSKFAEKINKNDTIEDLVRQMAISLEIYGGIALNVLLNRLGEVAEIYCLDFKNVRSNKKNTKFWYSEEWAEKSVGRAVATIYPAFDPENPAPSSIFYFKIDNFDTYPSPVWGGATTSAECLKHIGEFWLNSMCNGLSSDYIVNFNQGSPSDDQKAELEENFDQKHTSFANAGRTMLSFNPDVQHRTTIEAIPQTDFIDKYNSLYSSAIKDIFTAFRIHPALFGLPTDNSGFNTQDIAEAFKVANKTIVLPVQKIIKRIFETILKEKDAITITPLSIDWSDNEKRKSIL